MTKLQFGQLPCSPKRRKQDDGSSGKSCAGGGKTEKIGGQGPTPESSVDGTGLASRGGPLPGSREVTGGAL